MRTTARHAPDNAAGGGQATRESTPATAQIDSSARVLRMNAWAQRIDGSDRMVAQRQQVQALAHPPQQAAGTGVVQRELDEDEQDDLRQFLRERYEDPEDPPTWFQNAVFDYLGNNYDTLQEAIDAIEDAEKAVFEEQEQTRHAVALDSSSLPATSGLRGTGVPSASALVDDEDAYTALLDAFEQNPATASTSSSSHAVHHGDEKKTNSNDMDTPVVDDTAPAPVYAGFRQMAAALQKEKRKKYAAPKKSALHALIELTKKHPGTPPPELVAEASALVVRFQAAYQNGVAISETFALPNKIKLEADELAILNHVAQNLKCLADMDWARPAGIIATSYGTSSAADSTGKTHTLGQGGKTVTGRIGSKTGEAAFTMDAAIALNTIYGLTFKNAFIAGHLVTRWAGGKAADNNLAPLTGYFNQGLIRTPESAAEGMMRNDEVMSYSARAIYGRAGNDGSSVTFAKKDLDLIPTAVHVVVTRMALQVDGNAENIAHWNVEKTSRFNQNVALSLANVKAAATRGASGDSTSSSSEEM
ncbi:hypothetical protein LXA47_11925 [Massilia sp. P8910]|uniref:hypothetical protein n=1 Tax=Massilia antarctica TaxID=2765360 RepID=UPI001E2D0D00|nr:hypothetical protein [Massilia antarctica]MCE3604309.1 hypothetical protein [Massilia antarctica]